MRAPSILNTHLTSSFTFYFSSSAAQGLTAHSCSFSSAFTSASSHEFLPVCVSASCLAPLFPQGMSVFSIALNNNAWLVGGEAGQGVVSSRVWREQTWQWVLSHCIIKRSSRCVRVGGFGYVVPVVNDRASTGVY